MSDSIHKTTIQLVFGGEEKVYPILPFGRSQKWRAELLETMPELKEGGEYNVFDRPENMMRMVSRYTGETPEWLSDRATDKELLDAFNTMMEVSFPFAIGRRET